MTVSNESHQEKAARMPVAIVGMACLFPGSPGLKAYWQLLVRGRDAISDIPETHWSADAYYDADPKKPDHVYCKRGAFLPAVAFDPSEFGIPPSSLEATDTSQLLALITARDALEDAGYGSGETFNHERTSVVLGVTGTQEMVIPLGARLGHPIWRDAILKEGISGEAAENIVRRISDAYVPWQENSFPGLLGNVVAGRICNRLDLGGTNCVVDAACASSMSAVHLGLLELQAGRSDMVITGGVDTINDIFMHMCFSKTLILSKTGDVRPFSKDADGTVLGEGIGMVVLKRLSQAEADGDRIYAVIKGMGSSSDGRSQSIYAPRVQGQAKALRMAYEAAQVETASIGLVEAHGTGTRVGDKVELSALKTVYGSAAGKRNSTAIGSVKSMIGHTKAAAGAAGLIKTTLALKNKVLPPSLKAEKTDPDLNLEESPFYINSTTRPWLPPQTHPRRAAVSSFGFGGSNFHLVLEEYDSQKKSVSWDGSVEIFALSAQNRQGLSEKLVELKVTLAARLTDPFAVNRSAADTRRSFKVNHPCRLLFVHEASGSMEEDAKQFNRTIDRAQKILLENVHQDVRINSSNIFFADKPETGKIGFIFPGQGSQYVGMGRDLCCTFPEALNALTLADAQADPGKRISDYVFPITSGDPAIKNRRLSQTDVAQPAIGSISLGMFDILKRFEIHPEAVGGHSYGELSALHAAGWMDREAFATLSGQRGRAMADASKTGPQGAMLAVKAAFSDIHALVAEIPDVVLANLNSPQQCVLSGTLAGIERAEKSLNQKGLRCMRLTVSAAFHSPMIQNAQVAFKKAVQEAELRATDIPVFANSTGKPYLKETEGAKSILSGQMLQPVHFLDLIENMYAAGVRTFVEVGPKNVLTGLVKSILATKPHRALAMDASNGKNAGVKDLACFLSEMAAMGHPVRLDRWEDAVPDARERRMTIMLNGANVRSEIRRPAVNYPAAPARSADPGKPGQVPETYPDSTSVGSSGPDTAPRVSDNKTTTSTKHIQNQMKHIEKSKRSEHTASAFADNALQTVTQGLKSMQALQASTTEAHQKFLETQAEAGRNLQRMMESTQRLAEAALGLPTTVRGIPERTHRAAQRTPVETDTVVKGPATPQPPPIQPGSLERRELPPGDLPVSVQTQPKTDDRSLSQLAEPTAPDTGIVTTTLLHVVSELTGYPVDMLNMDMDIESDLGIDSIKRVEILSSLEEKLPGLPGVEPDTMATLKTLAQIVEYLGQDSPGGQAPLEGESSSAADQVTRQQPHMEKTALASALLGVVSDLTGYPVDMLDVDMDIESDLGIDSIKRVEILSTLEERVPGLPDVTPEMMGSLKTLGQIVAYLTGSSDDPTGLQTNDKTRLPSPQADQPVTAAGARALSGEGSATDAGYKATLVKKYVEAHETPRQAGSPLTLKPNAGVYILQDDGGLAAALVHTFDTKGVEAFLLTRARMKAILDRQEDVPRATGLIIPADVGPSTDKDADRFLKDAFMLVQAMAGELNSCERGLTTLLATISRLDGAFGFSGREVNNPAMGGLAGLLKTAAVEWPDVFCRAIDIEPAWNDLGAIAESIADELLQPTLSEPREIGLTADRRSTLALHDMPAVQGKLQPLGLAQNDVVVVAGGARGVTAAAAIALARRSGAGMALLGRSEAPLPEPAWLQGLTSPAAIKKAILENEFNNNGASPMDIERSYARHMNHREMRFTFKALEKAGVDMQYVSVDIRDRQKTTAAIERIQASMGRVAAVIHGAGVIEDRLIVDKTADQLDLVFDTKVKGLRHLLAATRKNGLKHLVIFSSVSARNGNSGQADYAMANEVLNKVAVDFSHKNPDCRVNAINWGPWDGGMVTPTLKKVFDKQNIGLIPLEEGARCMLAEMGTPQENHPVEIVIGSMLPPSAPAKATTQDKNTAPDAFEPHENSPHLMLSFKKEIDTIAYPILSDHIIGGKPVVPFALITEWFGHGALHENPGLVLHGIDDMRILKGVRLDAQKKLIRLFAGKPSRKNGHYEVSVELRDGVMEGRDVIHSRGKAILTDAIPKPPDVDISRFHLGDSYHRSVQEVYDDILFHGVELHGIKEILSCSPRGMAAKISAAPSPSRWIKDHLRSGWIADPLVLDCAFQMATVWCYEETGNVSLPSYCASYRQYCAAFPTEGVTALLEVVDLSDHKMTGNFLLLDKDNRLAARMTGYEAVLDASLFKAFKPDQPSA